MIKGTIHQEVITIQVFMYLITEVQEREVKSDRIARINTQVQNYSWRFQIPLSQ